MTKLLECAVGKVKYLPDVMKSRILGEFIRRVEEMEIISSGYKARALATAYYQLAHCQWNKETPII